MISFICAVVVNHQVGEVCVKGAVQGHNRRRGTILRGYRVSTPRYLARLRSLWSRMV